MYYRSAAQRCLALPEIIHEIGTYLPSADDLLDASCVNRQWKEVLVPLRAHFPHVYLRDLPSFLLFLKSNPRAGHSCHGLRVSVCCGLRLRGLTADTLLRSSLMKIIGMEMTPFSQMMKMSSSRMLKIWMRKVRTTQTFRAHREVWAPTCRLLKVPTRRSWL